MMKMMKKLPALILAAAIAPALALSTAAFAEYRDDMESDMERHSAEQRDGEKQAGEQKAGEQYISGKPAGGLYSDDVIGKTVKHRGSDEDIGEIQELIIGDDGRVVGVVVTTGGFLGLGGQDVGLGWDHIEHSMEDEESVFYVDIDEETLRNAPEHEREDQ